MGIILALDVAFCNTGWAVVDAGGANPEPLVAAGCITTKPSRDKGPKGAADIERVAEIARGLEGVVDRYGPHLIVGELPYGSKDASAAVAAGICKGILGSLRVWAVVPCVWVTPQAGKKALTGSASGSKAKVQDAVLEIWPEVGTLVGFEHICDALAGLVAARGSDLYMMAATQ